MDCGYWKQVILCSEREVRFRAEWDNKAEQLSFQQKMKSDAKQTKAELQLLSSASVQVWFVICWWSQPSWSLIFIWFVCIVVWKIVLNVTLNLYFRSVVQLWDNYCKKNTPCTINNWEPLEKLFNMSESDVVVGLFICKFFAVNCVNETRVFCSYNSINIYKHLK